MHYKRLWRTGSAKAGLPSKIEAYERARDYFLAATGVQTDSCIIWPYRVQNGYGVLGNRRVHSLACEQAHGPRPPGLVACHGPCHNRSCFNHRHVSWGTPARNARDRSRDGTSLVGERHPGSKLVGAEIANIRERYRAGARSQQQLAQEFGVSQPLISKIILRKLWSHVL